jgi:hypothetical protein
LVLERTVSKNEGAVSLRSSTLLQKDTNEEKVQAGSL